jgi:hypothetical protein
VDGKPSMLVLSAVERLLRELLTVYKRVATATKPPIHIFRPIDDSSLACAEGPQSGPPGDISFSWELLSLRSLSLLGLSLSCELSSLGDFLSWECSSTGSFPLLGLSLSWELSSPQRPTLQRQKVAKRISTQSMVLLIRVISDGRPLAWFHGYM